MQLLICDLTSKRQNAVMQSTSDKSNYFIGLAVLHTSK